MTNFYILIQPLAHALIKEGIKLAVAESCTGGMLAALLTDIPGSSAWFDCGFVTYSNEAKSRLLGVPPSLIQQDGAVSESVAIVMVKGVLKHSQADIAISITGLAGPTGGSPKKPVGTVWFGLMKRNHLPSVIHVCFHGARQHIRSKTVAFAIKHLIQLI